MFFDFMKDFVYVLLVVLFANGLVVGITYLFDKKPESFPKEINHMIRKLGIYMGVFSLIAGALTFAIRVFVLNL